MTEQIPGETIKEDYQRTIEHLQDMEIEQRRSIRHGYAFASGLAALTIAIISGCSAIPSPNNLSETGQSYSKLIRQRSTLYREVSPMRAVSMYAENPIVKKYIDPQVTSDYKKLEQDISDVQEEIKALERSDPRIVLSKLGKGLLGVLGVLTVFLSLGYLPEDYQRRELKRIKSSLRYYKEGLSEKEKQWAAGDQTA